MHENDKDTDSTVESSQSSISWQVDFSGCGLAVKSILIKARAGATYDGDSHVTFSVEGDKGTSRTIEFGGKSPNKEFISKDMHTV